MGDADRIEFTWSDEWLLEAIRCLGPEKGATLKDVIAAGDALNHAIFTPAELRTGLAKLLAARHIVEKEGKWFIHEAGRDPSVKGTSTWTSRDPNFQDPRWNYPLSDGVIEQAFRDYLRDSAKSRGERP